MKILYVSLFALILFSCKSEKEQSSLAKEEPADNNEFVVQQEEKFEISPISHATMVMNWDGTIIYVDPVGGGEAFANHPSPDLILVTDIHGDHLNVETLEAVSTDKTKMIVPQAVADKLPTEFDAQVDVLNNGDTKERYGFKVEAIPMYNLREEALKFHVKGRGNGYVVEKDEKRVYISGDTEDIPEMRALKDIDVAFVCMNLPYTMTEISAADAVVDFKPKKVYPYHYRGSEGLSDVNKFKDRIMKSSASKDIEVVQLDWYPNKE
jgi:L-ascorbate metabolism protein UlaG (beta-lactamase superfamily)